MRTLVEVQEFSELADLGNVRFGAVILDLNRDISSFRLISKPSVFF
ncbi:hypothetical protein SynA15127_02555 [Synechococcus sp. A15-127]|nr:hypothetical protein SynA15127_02555 [Synechococcus sp. A15-127]